MTERRILDSWQEIADYLGRTVRTCQRYEREFGLPIHRLDDSPKARVFAYADELDAWREKRPLPRPSLIGRLLSFAKAKPIKATLAAGLVLSLGIGAVWVVARLIERVAPSERLTIAVLPVHYTSGPDKQASWTADIPPLLVSYLSGSKYFTVLSYERTLGVLRELGLGPGSEYSDKDIQKFAGSIGATHVISCVVTGTGSGRVAVLSVRKPGEADTFSSRHEIQGEATLNSAAGRMADQIKRDIGLTRTTQAGDFDALCIPVTTSSLKAFRLYNEGRRCHLKQEHAKSIRLMRQALACDPDFALAWRSMGVSFDAMRKTREASKCFARAFELSPNASIQEQFFIKTCYLENRSELGLALRASREWMSLYPDDTQALIYHGIGCLYTEDAEGASEDFAETLRKGDRNPYAFYWTALTSTALGRFDEADRIRELGLSVHPENSLIMSTAVVNAIAQGQFDLALSELAPLQNGDWNPGADLTAGDVLLLKGDFRAAKGRYIQAGRSSRAVKARLARLALAEGRYGPAAKLATSAGDLSLVAYVAWRLGGSAAGIAASERALNGTPDPGQTAREHSVDQLTALLLQGALEVQAGDLGAAKATAVRFSWPDSSGLDRAKRRAAKSLEGLIAAASGQQGRAVAEHEGAVALLSRDVAYNVDQSVGFCIMAATQALTLYQAARQYEAAGDSAKALGLFQRLIALNAGRLNHPDLYALSWCAAGRILEGQGNVDEARRSYAKFLDLWKNADSGLPEVEDARARLALLEGR